MIAMGTPSNPSGRSNLSLSPGVVGGKGLVYFTWPHYDHPSEERMDYPNVFDFANLSATVGVRERVANEPVFHRRLARFRADATKCAPALYQSPRTPFLS